MIKRHISKVIKRWAKQYPVVVITGPRQSGKTTLVKALFKDKPYVSLEDLDMRLFAKEDPRGFLSSFSEGVVLDEVQYVPQLFSYIQTIVDEENKPGMFILTGSQQFEVMKGVKQSLAGRVAIAKLLPFSMYEIYNKNFPSLEEILYTGFYPRIFDKGLNPTEAMSFYVSTYLERDVADLVNIKNVNQFEIFLKLCAGRIGQILNLSSLGNDCGVSHNTIRSWLSILEHSFIIRLLYPYYRNFGKRFIKSAKIYFLDVGLASYLLGITSPKHLLSHPLKGQLFESFVFSEMLKMKFNRGKADNLYYFRDVRGNEVDIIMDNGNEIDLVEVKLAQTIADMFFKGIFCFRDISKIPGRSYVVYTGNRRFGIRDITVLPYKKLKDIFLE